MRKRTLAALALSLFSLTLSAQTVDEIIAKNIKAHGGLAKLKGIQSIRMTGDFDAGPMQAGFTQVYKRPMKIRIEASIQGLTLIQAYDGQNGWQVVPFTGKKDAEPMAADDLKNFQEQADFEGPLVDYKQKGHTVELIGKEKIEGTDVYHLKITLKNGDIRNYYLDADSFLAVKVSGKSKMQGTEVDVDSTLGDYKEVEGVLFPFSLEQHIAGGQGPTVKITIKKVELNVPVDDSAFKMPPPAPPAAVKPATSPQPDSNSGSKPPQD